jgi:hypothetical protein
MRMNLASESVVETVVTLAAAALMTFAGFAMLAGAVAAPDGGPAGATSAGLVAAPHVDAARG